MLVIIRYLKSLFLCEQLEHKQIVELINLRFNEIHKMLKELSKQMAALDDRIAKLQQDVQNVAALVQSLRDELTNNGVSQDALDKLDAIDAGLDAIAPDPTPPAPPSV